MFLFFNKAPPCICLLLLTFMQMLCVSQHIINLIFTRCNKKHCEIALMLFVAVKFFKIKWSQLKLRISVSVGAVSCFNWCSLLRFIIITSKKEYLIKSILMYIVCSLSVSVQRMSKHFRLMVLTQRYRHHISQHVK